MGKASSGCLQNAEFGKWSIEPLYGQADAPREWYKVATRKLQQLGFAPHPLECCLFRLFDESGRLVCLIGLRVDDMLGAGDPSSSMYQRVKGDLRKTFDFKYWSEEKEDKQLCKLKKIGEQTWQLHQEDYVPRVRR